MRPMGRLVQLGVATAALWCAAACSSSPAGADGGGGRDGGSNGSDGGSGGTDSGFGGSDSGSGTDGGGASTATVFPNEGGPPAYNVALAIDSSGGLHMAYMEANGAAPTARYGHCVSGCANGSGWTFTDVASAGLALGAIGIAVDSTGHPRIMFTDSANGLFVYAECLGGAGCGATSDWATGTAATYGKSGFDPAGNRFLAVDRTDHPHFVYWDQSSMHSGTFFAACNGGGCTNSANWTEVQISANAYLDDFTLKYDAQNNPRITYKYLDSTSGNEFAAYAECNASCDGAGAAWGGPTFMQIAGTGSDITFDLDSSGGVHTALYTGGVPTAALANQIVYFDCAGDCSSTDAGTFNGVTLDLTPGYGESGVAIAMTPAGAPLIAYLEQANPYGVGVASCVAAPCDGVTGSWQGVDADTGARMDVDWPIPPPANCTVAHWFPGSRMAMVLNAQGLPRFAYDAQHESAGGACTTVQTDTYAIRYVQY